MPTPIHPRVSVLGLLLLTASTGIVDAASYLALDRVFTGNMTGNVLFLGFAAMGVGGIPFLNNLLALLGFVAGSIVGGRLVGRGHPERSLPRSSAIALGLVALVFLVLSIVWLALGDLAGPLQLIVTVLLAVAMGVQVSAVKPIGNSDVTTIVVTNTIANLARDSRLGGGPGERWIPRLLAVVAMGFGAALGAAAVSLVGGGLALLLSAVVVGASLAVLLVADRSRSRV
ncbi:YoaK family protein [Schumannella sp. 10F1B-5-1]|uniref:YoaK family protein n=1 Tax=Schumannella sp. 10F1B-5-1 TaxID=2590780 RepID=UPI0011318501|nr:YoaK family protein [Schumannella sp. 10F1B-5-1]TPW71732.1 DUF1275 domain-containing protein [Schumannella sp. 10F1B-5-1]